MDRDGVLNAMVIHPEHGLIDSPLRPEEVTVHDDVPQVLLELNQMGFQLAVVTNQPAAAKKKTTMSLLMDVHQEVLRRAQSKGAKIEESFICFHKAEDGCNCRKPKIGLFEQAAARFPDMDKNQSWMVGDGVTDVQAGTSFGLKTAFLGPQKCDACKIFDQSKSTPNLWCADLSDFIRQLKMG